MEVKCTSCARWTGITGSICQHCRQSLDSSLAEIRTIIRAYSLPALTSLANGQDRLEHSSPGPTPHTGHDVESPVSKRGIRRALSAARGIWNR